MEILKLESENYLSACRKNVFSIIAIFMIILILYSNTFDASWHLDDESNILDRRAIHLTELTWPQIKKTFFNEDGNLYRPVPCLSLALFIWREKGQKKGEQCKRNDLILPFPPYEKAYQAHTTKASNGLPAQIIIWIANNKTMEPTRKKDEL